MNDKETNDVVFTVKPIEGQTSFNCNFKRRRQNVFNTAVMHLILPYRPLPLPPPFRAKERAKKTTWPGGEKHCKIHQYQYHSQEL